jgi:hypothetical protein
MRLEVVVLAGDRIRERQVLAGLRQVASQPHAGSAEREREGIRAGDDQTRGHGVIVARQRERVVEYLGAATY